MHGTFKVEPTKRTSWLRRAKSRFSRRASEGWLEFVVVGSLVAGAYINAAMQIIRL